VVHAEGAVRPRQRRRAARSKVQHASAAEGPRRPVAVGYARPDERRSGPAAMLPFKEGGRAKGDGAT
jgi:hypothetical protein